MKRLLLFLSLSSLLLGGALTARAQSAEGGEVRISLSKEGKTFFEKTQKVASWQEVCDIIKSNGIPLDPEDAQEILAWKPDVTKMTFTYEDADSHEMMVILRRVLQDDGFSVPVPATNGMPAKSDPQIAP